LEDPKPTEVMQITSFDQIAAQLAAIITFLSQREVQSTVWRATAFRLRKTEPDEQFTLEEAAQLRWIQSMRDACQLALECAEYQNAVAKATVQTVLGTVHGWNELEKQRDAEVRQRKEKEAADRKAKRK
jgi:hypothetical protein